MTSLREIILGETKLQEIILKNRESEPVLQGKGVYHRILKELSEENELYQSDKRVRRVQDSIQMGIILGSTGVVYEALIGKLSLANQLVPIVFGVLFLHKYFTTKEQKRGEL